MHNELESFHAIHEEIEKGIVFKGTNLWILICAILVASVGLNVNSTAVIIGAMLISPLMGPINGMGYSIATYDWPLFRRAVKNFTFAVVVSLISSALYFLITPVNTAHSELLARTSPTIYDVFIAFFGGLAGILAISSKLKGNVIPGVAIATALMPPICTAGYGLATLQFNFVFGALYLFTINTVFIAGAALVVCQILKFPIRSIVDPGRRKRVNSAITGVLLVTLIPSIILGYNLVEQERFGQRTDRYVQNINTIGSSYLLDRQIDANHQTIRLMYSGYGPNEQQIAEIKQKALVFGLDSAKVHILSGNDTDVLQQSTTKYRTQAQEMERQFLVSSAELQRVGTQLDSLERKPTLGQNMLQEISQLFPQITKASYAETTEFGVQDTTLHVPIVIFGTSATLNTTDKNKVVDWVKARVKNDNAKVYFE